MSRPRIQSLDILRGLVMVIMAIDHVRDFFHAAAMQFAPEDLTKTTAAIFFTRWITHFCAPTFVFFAGTSAYLSGRSRGRAALSRFLVTRGLWLIVIENTLVLGGETFNLSYGVIIWQVMWAIGWSMLALAVLIHLPRTALLAVSLGMIAGHNLLDGISPEQFGGLAWLWQILHVGPAPIQVSQNQLIVVIYPLIPWIGVMGAGYCFGPVMELDAPARRRTMLQLGAAAIALFVALRFVNVYGDPNPWSPQPTGTFTLLSFLNASKYPPSLLFLLMTLGPSIVVLGLLDGVQLPSWNPFLVFGKVPFFYYILHWYVLHGLAMVFAWFAYGRAAFLTGLPPSTLPWSSGYPPDYGYSLATTYAAWAIVIALVYGPCWWFARVKSRGRSWWLSYL